MWKELTYRHIYFLNLIVVAVLLGSCKTTKFVPEGEYLLDKAKIEVDNKQVDKSSLRNYLRQTQNSEVFGFWKMQLDIYNMQGRDTSKWINRQLRKIGEEPVIYSPAKTRSSIQQLDKAMFNLGYFNAHVDTTTTIRAPQKIRLTYSITSSLPYTIRSYNQQLSQHDLMAYASDRQRMLIKEGDQYNAATLDEERQRITTRMQNAGYYFFEQDMLRFRADSAHNNNTVDLTLCLQNNILEAEDTVRHIIFTQYKIRHVTFNIDTTNSGRQSIRQRTIERNCYIKEGEMYSLRKVERTYTALNSLGIVKYVNIAFTRVSDDELDCEIAVTRGKVNSFTAEIEGTYSAGDWGIGAGVGYVNRNIFKGAEQLSLNAKGSYEWRQNGGRAIEAKTDASLRFPTSLQLNVAYQYQNRPEEYTRTIANAGMSYQYHKPRSQWYHNFSLLDIGYVYLPWISDSFRSYFLQNSNILKYSYEDHFIMSWGYNASFSSYNSRTPLKDYLTAQFSVETAGNALYGVSKLFSLPTDDDGAYKIFNIRFAQYAKADVNFTYHQIFNKNNSLVYHAFLGVAVPFGNASSIPFEKRYFGGGANSVRGWTMRSLGPGTYKGTGTRIDFNNQAGDIKLDLNLEYRIKIFKYLEAATFTDAGNIWTIRDYDTQAGGVFRFSEFYKQLAWAYGVGIRLNFDYFVFRVDLGVKLYDPSRIADGTAWRTVPNGLRWKDDFSLHFAIGYPF